MPELPPMPFIELTEKQLLEYDGSRADGRILIAFKGNIYDVSNGLEEFGSKGALGCVAGKNFTEYLNHTLPATETKIDFIQRWEFLLDKNYKRVGVLIDDNGKKVHDNDDNQGEITLDDGEQEINETFNNISDDNKLGESSIETIINESVIEVNDKTINLMKDHLPDEMLENELPPKCLNEELI
ncbi:membrane steroid-binding protein 2 [Drosophila innubila]|uniref:membrane steroid-binding protein 2 n=1 Tax=Drosophila innubila TaxID=198719 RepID=UPI00148D44DC|nr:membrane steroid-binding protein 2 [Drosophila innubila]